MIDPVSAFALASGAFNMAKKLVETGREIEDVAGYLGKFFDGASAIKAAKEKPGQLTVGVGSLISAHYVMAKAILGRNNVNARVIPFDGGGPLLKAILANQVTIGVIHSPILARLALAAAAAHPEVPMIWSSGDNAWSDGEDYAPELANLGNSMGRMEYAKMIAGCAAALTSQTGSISYLGPLINGSHRAISIMAAS